MPWRRGQTFLVLKVGGRKSIWRVEVSRMLLPLPSPWCPNPKHVCNVCIYSVPNPRATNKCKEVVVFWVLLSELLQPVTKSSFNLGAVWRRPFPNMKSPVGVERRRSYACASIKQSHKSRAGDGSSFETKG